MSVEMLLHKRLEKLCPVWTSFLRDLVRVPSPTGFEQKAQAMVASRMRDMGVFDREVFVVPGPGFHDTSRRYDDRPNVVGRLPGRGDDPFILNAHVDTAPVEDPSTWSHPPYAAHTEDGKLFGRGAQDDKAGVAMMLCLAQAFLEEDIVLPGDLLLESVIEDEDSGNGTLACTLAGYTAPAALVVDGTWPFRIIDAHLGQVWLDFSITGVPVAACSCSRGKNPIDAAFHLFRALSEFVAQKNDGLSWHGHEQPYFFNAGAVHAGVWPGAVPEKCSFSCQMGFPPPETPQSLMDRIQEMAAWVSEQTGCAVSMKPGALSALPFANRDNTLARVLAQTITRLRKGEMQVAHVAVMGHCDLRHLKNSQGGASHACLYGPGGGANPHVRDEYYLLDHFVPVAQNIASAILAWYGRL